MAATFAFLLTFALAASPVSFGAMQQNQPSVLGLPASAECESSSTGQPGERVANSVAESGFAPSAGQAAVPESNAAQQAPSTPPAVAAVPTGRPFLVRLEDKLSTKKHKAGKKFKVKTLDPLEAVDGTIIPPGAEIRGHISRVEPAGLTGRARLWLSFDDIRTSRGRLPIVAQVTGVPGEHSVRQEPSKEGEIEARTSKGTREIQAAAAGAAIGAAVGAAAKGGKGAAIGAAIGAASGFLIATGLGQELELDKGTKIELELERPLYLTQK